MDQGPKNHVQTPPMEAQELYMKGQTCTIGSQEIAHGQVYKEVHSKRLSFSCLRMSCLSYSLLRNTLMDYPDSFKNNCFGFKLTSP